MTQAVRRLIDASIHTGADADTIGGPAEAIDEVSATLEASRPTGRARCGTPRPDCR